MFMASTSAFGGALFATLMLRALLAFNLPPCPCSSVLKAGTFLIIKRTINTTNILKEFKKPNARYRSAIKEAIQELKL